MKGLVTILIFIFAVEFTASACAGEAAPKNFRLPVKRQA